MQQIPNRDKCKLCNEIDTKRRSIGREEDKIRRWLREPNRSASIEKAQGDIATLKSKVAALEYEVAQRRNTFRYW